MGRSAVATRSHSLKVAAVICRYFVALLFIVSGFTKVVDPWGTAMKVDEYLAIYELAWLSPLSMILSIWLSGVEMLMGCMLLFKVRIRLVSIFAIISMSFFTILTLLSATVLPVEDCGCFGEAFKLTPWQTFFKNLVVLPCVFTIWYRYRPDKIFVFKLRELILALVFFVSIMGISTYCYMHLPFIDFLPYKVGVDLREGVKELESVEPTDVVLVYKNLSTNELKEFSLDDTEWYDDTKWEWVETRSVEQSSIIQPLLSEFMLRTPAGDDMTREVLATDGELYIICITRLDKVSKSCRRRLLKLIDEAQSRDARVICITPDTLQSDTFSLDSNHVIEAYNIDASTMKTMLRANVGVVMLNDGVITLKKNCRDI